ncbi:DNA-directed primase/polymerase protein isoform X3 [Anolis sagrei]|uniref:DNA-directed primase/polymerase protein isoform X3 n=1 Tax=Anolis sagrei TaxID=38937 RepID=UPI003521123B
MSTRQSKRKWEEKLKSIEELSSLYKRRPLCERYKPQLSKPWQPSSVWKLFHRQNQAFNFAKSCKEDVHVFALERSAENKQRFYLVTTYTELWFYYSKHRETSLMHCYEVIPETAVCKLYFDLEFYKPANKGADGKQMVAGLIEFVCEKLDEHYGVKCSTGDILNLDSSTEEKFSCHLIFQLHNAAFKNNIHIGNFLRRILEPAVLLIKNKDAMAVEKQVLPASRCSKATTDLPKCLENQTVSNNVPSTCQFNSQIAMEKGTPQGKGERDLSFLIMNGKEGGKQLFVDLDSIGGYHCSPYPEIDNFVLSLVSKDSVQGGIRRWNYFSLEQLLVYDILNYRWCRNIGRAHKSNNIMIIVDLKQENWYQKCHDPVCRAENFRSESFSLPSEVCLPFLFKEEEEYEYIMDECGNIEEKSKTFNPTIDSSGSTSLAALQQISDPDSTKRSSLEWDDEADIFLLEASEDVELAEAAASFQPQRDWSVDEIPDELLVDALQNHEIKE